MALQVRKLEQREQGYKSCHVILQSWLYGSKEADAGTKRMPMIERRLGDVTKWMNDRAVYSRRRYWPATDKVFIIASGTQLSLALHREEIERSDKRARKKRFYFYS